MWHSFKPSKLPIIHINYISLSSSISVLFVELLKINEMLASLYQTDNGSIANVQN